MSTFLYRVGRAAYRHPLRAIGAWVLLLAVLIGALVLNPPRLSTEFRIDGTPARLIGVNGGDAMDVSRQLQQSAAKPRTLLVRTPAQGQMQGQMQP